MANRPPLQSIARLALLVAFAVGVHAVPAGAQGTSGIKVIVRPILVQTPIFGASIDLPKLPSAPPAGGGGDDGSEVSGSTDISLNAAYEAGLEVRADRWFGEISGTWANVSASHALPRVDIATDTRLYGGRGGVRLVGGLFATGGFRRLTSNLTATLTLPNGKTIEGHASPGLWDPLIGAAWRGALGKHLDVELAFQGGGFGVGTDVDISADAVADWRIVGPLQLRFGWTTVYYKLTVADVQIGAFQRTVVSKQTLHGPILGIGLAF